MQETKQQPKSFSIKSLFQTTPANTWWWCIFKTPASEDVLKCRPPQPKLANVQHEFVTNALLRCRWIQMFSSTIHKVALQRHENFTKDMAHNMGRSAAQLAILTGSVIKHSFLKRHDVQNKNKLTALTDTKRRACMVSAKRRSSSPCTIFEAPNSVTWMLTLCVFVLRTSSIMFKVDHHKFAQFQRALLGTPITILAKIDPAWYRSLVQHRTKVSPECCSRARQVWWPAHTCQKLI